MKKIVLYTNKDELRKMHEFMNKSISTAGLADAIAIYFTNDKNKTKYYPIKIIMNCYNINER